MDCCMSPTTKLTETLDNIRREVDGDRITFGELVEALNHRGFGPLLLTPVLVAILPTGAVPGVPAICSMFMALVAIQMIFGRRYPWIPKKLKALSFKRNKFIYTLRKVRPYTQKLDRFIRPRLTWLSCELIQRVTAVICLAFAVLIMILGFVPFMPTILGLPILFFALGLSAKDGAMTLIGFSLTVASILLLGCALGISCVDDRMTIGDPEFIYQHFNSANLGIMNAFNR